MQRFRVRMSWAAISTGVIGLLRLAFAHNAGAAYTLTLLIGLGAASFIASSRG